MIGMAKATHVIEISRQ